MRIVIITPTPVGSRKGNRITAVRYARLLRELGHRVTIRQEYHDEPCDVLVALHARRSFAALAAFRHAHPKAPLIVVLTGTDVYGDIHKDRNAQQSLEMASRLVVLQPLAVNELTKRLRSKARVVLQSAEAPPAVAPTSRHFDVCVMGHLRPVKDPFRTALAARRLPAASQVRVLHVGAALTPDMERRAKAESSRNPRYRWLGNLPRSRAMRVMARSRLLVLTSQLEGGANVISEALAASVPILGSRIPGSVGILGADYPGFFPYGDTAALTQLLLRAERDAGFYRELKRHCRRLKSLVRPLRERETWRRILHELDTPAEDAR